MGDSMHWGRSRSIALGLVLLLHTAFIALAWRAPIAPAGDAAAPAALQLLVLPPKVYPRLRLQIAIARPLGGDAAITLEPPRLQGDVVAAAPGPADADTGSRDGVDWTAEARREMQAMEIRRNRNPGINTISMRVGEDYWMVHAKHFPGDQLKTANGDWIVWLNDDCYQIATASPAHPVSDSLEHVSICRDSPQVPAQ